MRGGESLELAHGRQRLNPPSLPVPAAGNEPAPLASAEGYNPAKRRWESLAAMPTARCSSALLQTDAMLFVIGGVAQGPSDAVEALCLTETV